MGEGMISYDGITQERGKARSPYPKLGAFELELRAREGLPGFTGYGVTIRGKGAA